MTAIRKSQYYKQLETECITLNIDPTDLAEWAMVKIIKQRAPLGQTQQIEARLRQAEERDDRHEEP